MKLLNEEQPNSLEHQVDCVFSHFPQFPRLFSQFRNFVILSNKFYRQFVDSIYRCETEKIVPRSALFREKKSALAQHTLRKQYRYLDT